MVSRMEVITSAVTTVVGNGDGFPGGDGDSGGGENSGGGLLGGGGDS